MAGLELTVSPGFLLLAAGLYFIGGSAALTAFFTAALAHELGHLTALYITGASIRGIRVTCAGPVIEYAGVTTRRQEIGVVAAGPVAGLLFAAICFLTDIPYFCYVGAIALLAAMFNLLPVLPMDGGRLTAYALSAVLPDRGLDILMRVLGSLCSVGVFITGVMIRSPAAAAAGIWMAVLANAPDLR